jgi:hypothetical protein
MRLGFYAPVDTICARLIIVPVIAFVLWVRTLRKALVDNKFNDVRLEGDEWAFGHNNELSDATLKVDH